ncbi:MAG: sugar ABC transporter permease [Clostridiales bacterium]|nr:sugar ABC transporter permease [Clostridiales bacterium]
MNKSTKKKKKFVNYSKWGYIFLIPFFVTYAVFSLIPLISTFYYSFFKYFFANGGLEKVGPTFVGFDNFKVLFTSGDFFKYFSNTMAMWIIGFIPQIVFALLLAVLFTSNRLRLKRQGFFKTVIYMPNLIMASAFSMLIYTIFTTDGPINMMLKSWGWIEEPIRFFTMVGPTRAIIGGMNFMMWFGNTTIMLMAGIMGIDQGLFEAAYVDGAKSWHVFRRITLPLLKPILSYTLITSLIGGIQMFDVPQIISNGMGTPNKTTQTIVMLLNQKLTPSMNYGSGGAISVILFIITAILSMMVYNTMKDKTSNSFDKYNKKQKAKRGA